MDNLNLLLEQINYNLNTIIKNQILMYQKLELLHEEVKKEKNE